MTQSAEAVVSLLKYLGKPIEPLPEVVELPGMVLVLASKRNMFYAVTEQHCSCPSFAFRGGPCKHQRKYFSESNIKRQSLAETLDEADKNLDRMPKRYRSMVLAARNAAEAEDDPDSVMPRVRWAGGFNGPVDPEIIALENARRQQGA